jgi:hypothetical protein
MAAFGTAIAQPVELISASRSPGDGEMRKPNRPVTVSVDCTRGQSVNKALGKLPSDSEVELVVEIHGMCEENVVVRGLTNVTLRGTDPEQDGISAVSQENDMFPFGGALTITESYAIRVESLMVTGRRPLWVYSSTNVNATNCELIGIEGGAATFGSMGSLVLLNNNTISSPENWAIFALHSLLYVDDGVVSGRNGILSALGASVNGENLTVNSTGAAVYASDAGSILLETSELAGEVISSFNSSVVLTGVTQTEHGSWGWGGAFERSSLQVWDGTQLLGPVYVEAFSDAVVRWGSTVLGDLECWDGGDAFCEDPGSIWGAYGCPSIPWFGAAESATSSNDSRPDLSSLRREIRSMIEEGKRD